MSDDARVAFARDLLGSDVNQLIDRSVVAGVVDAYDERLRVNVGLVAENAALRKQVLEHRCGADQ